MSLVTSKVMLARAYQGGYAVGAFNVNNMEIMQGVVAAAKELRAPLILQASSGAIKYAGLDYIYGLVKVAAETSNLPICLHLDHGNSLELCIDCIDRGFTSVMIDGSSLPFEENVALTKKVVHYAHAHDVVVEAELGRLAGIEDDVNVADHQAIYTDPEDAKRFVEATEVDSLAIAIGTSHGAYKFKSAPHLRLDILKEVQERLPGLPIVLHGASSIPADQVALVNEYGGQMEGAKGVPGELLREAAKLAVCKINIDSDLRIAATAAIRKYLATQPKEFDPRGYLKEAREAITKLVSDKIINVLGCDHTLK